MFQHSPYEDAQHYHRNSIDDAVDPPNADVAANAIDAPASSANPTEISVATVAFPHILIPTLGTAILGDLGDLGSDPDADTTSLLLFVDRWLLFHFRSKSIFRT